MAGRALLINTTTSAIPNYFMNALSIPRTILKDIDKINRNFFWNHFDNSRNLHTISWNKISRPKSLGGIGIRNLKYLNACFMAKRKWNLFFNKDTIASVLLAAKYGPNLNLKLSRKSYGRQSLDKDLNIFNDNIKVLIGNGLNTSFWFDSWLSKRPIFDRLIGPLKQDIVDLTVSQAFNLLNINPSSLSQSTR